MAARETPAGELGRQDLPLKDAYGNPIRFHDLKGRPGAVMPND